MINAANFAKKGYINEIKTNSVKKFENEIVAHNLALCGAIKDDILPIIEVALFYIDLIKELYPNHLHETYCIDETLPSNEILANIGVFLKYYINKEIDYDRVSLKLCQDFRSNVLGKLTLDWNYDE